MCFYNDDYDWYASVCETTDGASDTETACHECGEKIAAGQWRRHVYQQEHDECQRCEWEQLDDDEEPCEQHDYGETYDYDCCESCEKILKAIEALEAEEDCPEHSRRPSLCGLYDEAICEDDDGKYRAKAIAMFPELANHKWFRDVETCA